MAKMEKWWLSGKCGGRTWAGVQSSNLASSSQLNLEKTGFTLQYCV